MTESNQMPSRAPAELMDLAKWIDDQLGATSISRQVIAEQAADRIRALADWLRGAARPGDDPAAEELRLAEAEGVIMDALATDAAQMPPSVLLRAHQEVLRQSRWLLGVVLGDPRLAESSHRVRPADKRAPLEAAILAELPESADDWERGIATSLAEFHDSTCELVARWLRDARAEGRIVTEAMQRRILDEALGAYGDTLRASLDAREAGDRDDEAGT